MAKEENIEEPIVDVTEAVNKTEELFENNKKPLATFGIAVTALIVGYFAYQNFIAEPNEIKADSKIWMAENNFDKDSLDLAVYGEGVLVPGFKSIAEDYSGTGSGELANYYLGIAELKKGNFENAIDHLNDFSTNDQLLSTVTTGAIGDAHMELGQLDKAETFYRRASNLHPNKLTSPYYLYKLGLCLEKQKSYEDALDVYLDIKKSYTDFGLSNNIDKYIGRTKQALGK